MNQYDPRYMEEEDDGSGLGTLAAILGATAAASPIGRRVIGRGAKAAGGMMPESVAAKARSAGQAMSQYMDPLTSQIGPRARSAASTMTGGVSEVGRRRFTREMEGPRMRQEPGGLDDVLRGVGIKRGQPGTVAGDWDLTKAEAKAIGNSVMDMAKAVPSAASKAFKKTDLAVPKMGFNPQTDLSKAKQDQWKKFLASEPGRKLDDQEIALIGSLFADNKKMTPMEAALTYMQYLAKNNL